jgi:predicted PurR-regulated permease PerM
MVEPAHGMTSPPAEPDDSTASVEASATSAATLTATAPATRRRRPPLHLMSPFRIGFVGTLGALVAYGLAQAIIQARSVLVLLVVAMFIALGLNPVVEFLIRRKLRRGLSVVLVFIAVLVVLGLVGFAVVPVVSEQITNLIKSAPSMLQDLLGDRRIKAFNDRFQLVSKAQQALSSGSLVQQLFGGILGAGKIVLGAVFSGVTLLILTLYFLASLPAIKNAIYRLTPASSRARVRVLEDTIFAQISAFISGTFVVAMIAGTLSFIFLLIVGLSEYALALALVIAVFDIIPLIGATIGAIIVCIVAFVDSTAVGIAAVIFYVAYQLFENYVLQPRVFKRAVDVPGALVVIAALIGAALLGVVGALLAVPVAAALLMLLRDVAQPRLDAG